MELNPYYRKDMLNKVTHGGRHGRETTPCLLHLNTLVVILSQENIAVVISGHCLRNGKVHYSAGIRRCRMRSGFWFVFSFRWFTSVVQVHT